ncbi:hypothetical protein [Chitinophaga polysaccharea]|uniref:hypothetical protein n=1 Tax=Chitinophaga polysaccharea TaxID=1293035 RepID=UPI0021AE72B1|nr:hypothetical protein [Chitinophaga polysaccharea]
MPPDLITYAIPGFVLLILLEIIFTAIDKKNMYEPKDALSSIAMGLGNVFIGIFTKAVIFGIGEPPGSCEGGRFKHCSRTNP